MSLISILIKIIWCESPDMPSLGSWTVKTAHDWYVQLFMCDALQEW